MTSFFRKFRWLTRRPARKPSSRRSSSSTWKRKPASARRKGWPAKRRDGPPAANWETSLWFRRTRAPCGSGHCCEQLAQDIRYGLRTMAANKTFSAMAILSLALGIGANTAIFSFMDSILLRSLPVPDPQSLVMLSWRTPHREFHGSNRHDNSFTDPNGGFIGGFFSYPAFELFRKNDSVFSIVFGYQGAGDLNLTFPRPGRARRYGIRVRRLFPRARDPAGRRAADRPG